MKILVGFTTTPEGQAALRQAAAEAKEHSATLLIAHYEQVTPPVGDVPERYRNAEERLEALRGEFAAEGIDVVTRSQIGVATVSSRLLQVAEDEAVDLIVIGLRRRTPVGKLVLGSTAQEVLLGAGCPVLAVKRDQTA